VWTKILASKFLFISIFVHLLLGIGATVLVVHRMQAKRKLTFAGGPPTTSVSKRALEHKVSMARKKNTMSAPAQAKRITTSGLSKVALPAMISMPTATEITPNKMGGMGGAGFGAGSPGGGGMGGGGGGGGLSLFGLRPRSGESNGLEGTFYDFKKTQEGKAIAGFDPGAYSKTVTRFTKSWPVPSPNQAFTSATKLVSRYFLFPAIQDSEAGRAFQSPESGPGGWIAHYKGSVAAPEAGSYRFVGFGDNVMIVRLGGRVVLDASDHGYTGDKREKAGTVKFPSKENTLSFFGDWFEMQQGAAKQIDVAVGDEGGIFCAGLFIQKRGTDFKEGRNGIPELPLFVVGQLGDADKKLLGQHVPESCLTGPFWKAQTGNASLLEGLKASMPPAAPR
jgi:hypothetical protein